MMPQRGWIAFAAGPPLQTGDRSPAPHGIAHSRIRQPAALRTSVRHRPAGCRAPQSASADACPPPCGAPRPSSSMTRSTTAIARARRPAPARAPSHAPGADRSRCSAPVRLSCGPQFLLVVLCPKFAIGVCRRSSGQETPTRIRTAILACSNELATSDGFAALHAASGTVQGRGRNPDSSALAVASGNPRAPQTAWPGAKAPRHKPLRVATLQSPN